jgi:muramoyltetrapeptide carboxypeptidase
MSMTPQPTRIKPAALRSGDKVGIVAPASNIKREWLERGCAVLRGLGYEPVYDESILDRDLYFAGTIERRKSELETMFTRDDIRAIICARGGYGSNYLAPVLDFKKIAMHPKIFVGYSDLTTLLCGFVDAANFVTFHGPMVTKDFANDGGVDLDSWNNAMSGVKEWVIGEESGARPLIEGRAEGVLYAGCLSILVASLGTDYEIRTDGAILFIEDVNAKPYQVDRMLMQLKLAGKLKGVRGLVFGEMLDCRQSADQDYTLEEVIERVVGDLKIPVGFGLRSGHVSRGNVTLPIGVSAHLSVDSGVELRILESATEKR